VFFPLQTDIPNTSNNLFACLADQIALSTKKPYHIEQTVALRRQVKQWMIEKKMGGFDYLATLDSITTRPDWRILQVVADVLKRKILIFTSLAHSTDNIVQIVPENSADDAPVMFLSHYGLETFGSLVAWKRLGTKFNCSTVLYLLTLFFFVYTNRARTTCF